MNRNPEQYSQLQIISKTSLSLMKDPSHYISIMRRRWTNDFRNVLRDNQMSGMSTFHIEIEDDEELVLRWSNYQFSDSFIEHYKELGYKVTELWNGKA